MAQNPPGSKCPKHGVPLPQYGECPLCVQEKRQKK
jgi:hypothetical protein